MTKGGKTKYYAADGTELKESYFKQVENLNVTFKSNDGKTYDLNKTIQKRLTSLNKNLEKAEEENGIIGGAWSWVKNTADIGDSSNKVRELQKAEQKLLSQFNSNSQNKAKIFQQLTGAPYSRENLEKFISGELKLKSEQALFAYKEGQEMAVDVVADVVSGVTAFTAVAGCTAIGIAGTPFTGGASLSLIGAGFGIAAATGAAVKTGIKYADAKTGGRKYTLKNAGHDAATGAFSGFLAPVTAGTGGAVGKVVTTQTIKAGLKSGAAKAVGFTTELAADGALGGGIDTAFRTAIDGGSAEEILDSGLTGAKVGLFAGPLLGWAGKGVVKGYGAAKGLLRGMDDAVPTPVPKRTRAELLEDILSGKKIKIRTEDADIQIPEVKFRAPGLKFAETDEAFRNIVRNHPKEFMELSKKSGDDFMNSAFKLVKKYMGLEDAPIEFKITDNINLNCLDEDNCYIAVSRNWTGKGHVLGKGDPAEIVGAIAHELNHMLQNKEGYINFINSGGVNGLNTKFALWLIENDEYFTNHSDFYVKKANSYMENWKNYIEPDVDYDAYLKQTIEAESHPRGNIVVEEYKKLIYGK